jgi:hypothetical protein
MTWHHLQYVIGLMRLGHDVVFVEDSDDYPSCYNPTDGLTTVDPSYGLTYAGDIFSRVGIPDCWAYFNAHGRSWLGPAAGSIQEFIASADVLLNVSAVNPLRSWFMSIPVRVLIDTDPVFTQIRHLTSPRDWERAARHTHFISFGENIGTSGCSIPDDGFCWQRTRQPIVLDLWPVLPLPPNAPFTTVMQWDSYKEQSHDGIEYGMKSKSFLPYLSLAHQTHDSLELALGSPSAPREKLEALGWRLRDPMEVSQSPWSYQAYITGSKAEFSVAKHGYVISYSGWFSERSACYLASCRPVLVQDTGFSTWLPTGTGVLAFTSPEEALEGLEEINGNLARHQQAAREIAADFFEASTILGSLIEKLSHRLV